MLQGNDPEHNFMNTACRRTLFAEQSLVVERK